jgi:hypothetical protein
MLSSRRTRKMTNTLSKTYMHSSMRPIYSSLITEIDLIYAKLMLVLLLKVLNRPPHTNQLTLSKLPDDFFISKATSLTTSGYILKWEENSPTPGSICGPAA